MEVIPRTQELYAEIQPLGCKQGLGKETGRAEPPCWAPGLSLALTGLSSHHAGQLQGWCVAPHVSVCDPTRPSCPSHHTFISVP